MRIDLPSGAIQCNDTLMIDHFEFPSQEKTFASRKDAKIAKKNSE